MLFGTAGIPLSSPAPNTQAGLRRLRELGLGCMEIQFVQGVKMGERAALVVKEAAEKDNIKLSAHAPYFINLNAHEEDKVAASEARLFQAARIAAICGAKSVVFHAAYYLNDRPEEVYEKVRRILERLVRRLRSEGISITIRPEVTGKNTQFGTIDEVLKLSTEIEMVAPCLDFAHWHARQGGANTYEEFMEILERVEKNLGKEALKDMHIHLSGIAYGKGGETKHLLLRESDFNYKDVLKALKDKGVEGLVICESPNLEGDALILQETYNSL